MRWRQVLWLYGVAALLGGVYVAVEWRSDRPAAAQSKPSRARMLPVTVEDVVRVELELDAADGRIVLERDGEVWAVRRPRGGHLHRDLVQAFVEALVGAEIIESVPADVADLATFGLGADATRVRLWSGAAEPSVVELGALNPTGTAVYARLVGGAVILIGRNPHYYLELIAAGVRRDPSGAPERAGPIASRRLTFGRPAG